MKRIIYFDSIFIIIMFHCNLIAQNEIEYSEVVEIKDVSKDVLYSNGLIWFVETFSDSRSVIQAKDHEAGMIIGNGIFEFYVEIPTRVFLLFYLIRLIIN